MKFALVNAERSEAKPNLNGVCSLCGSRVIPHCGIEGKEIWHWQHYNAKECDTWHETETEWHVNWKNCFPVDWQEAPVERNGEKHRADIKTCHDWVIEFQYSRIEPEERVARNAFYQKLIWVVSGMRRKTDRKQFFDALEDGVFINKQPLVKSVFIDDCRLLKEWANTHTPVFFDFGEENLIWWLLPVKTNLRSCLAAFSRKEFIDIHRIAERTKIDEFEKFVVELPALLKKKISHDFPYLA